MYDDAAHKNAVELPMLAPSMLRYDTLLRERKRCFQERERESGNPKRVLTAYILHINYQERDKLTSIIKSNINNNNNNNNTDHLK